MSNDIYSGVIYRYTFKDGDCYIGQSLSPNLRMRQHQLDAEKGKRTKLHQKMALFGEYSYETLKIVTVDNEQDLRDALDYWEAYYIELYDSVKNGLNMKRGNQFRDFHDNIDITDYTDDI